MCAREASVVDGLQCAGRPGGHVRTCVRACVRDAAADQVVHAGLHYMHADMHCMHAGWLAGRRALGEIGRSGRLVRSGQVRSILSIHPISCCGDVGGV